MSSIQDEQLLDEFSPSEIVYGWMVVLSLVSIGNIIAYIKICGRQINTKLPEDVQKYEKWMRILAGPFVFQCAWRSFLPSMYGTRTTFYDTPYNSIMVARTFATIGEVAWTVQVAFGIMFANKQIYAARGQKPIWFIDFICHLGVILICLAECSSDYGVATRNYWFAWLEVQLWTVGLGLMAPCALFLYLATYKRKSSYDNKAQLILLLAITITCVAFCGFCMKSYTPHMWFLHSRDFRAKTKFLPFWEGLQQATWTRRVSQSWTHWRKDLAWMGGYFTGGVWSSLLMATAPRGYDFDEASLTSAQSPGTKNPKVSTTEKMKELRKKKKQ